VIMWTFNKIISANSFKLSDPVDVAFISAQSFHCFHYREFEYKTDLHMQKF
jgi:hypothetical protein